MNEFLTLLMLIALQVVLSIDNLLYISLESKRVDPKDQKKVIRMGTFMAIGARIALLFILMSLVKYFQDPFFIFTSEYFGTSVSVHSLIVLLGGGFIMYMSIKEIGHMFSPELDSEHKKKASIKQVIGMIVVMNLVFSFDSILSAMALTNIFWIMAVAIVISGLLMLWLADKVSKFLNDNRNFEIGGLFVLMLVGIMLLSEGAHLAKLNLFGHVIHEMSKANFYFILVILIIVFIVNNKYTKDIIKNMKNIEPSAYIEDEEIEWCLKSVGQGYFKIKKGTTTKYFSIEDYHPSGDYKGPMKFKKEDALKVKRFLNAFYKDTDHMFNWKVYDRIKNQLGLKSGTYLN